MLGFNLRSQQPRPRERRVNGLYMRFFFVTVTVGTDGSPAMAVVKPPCGCQWYVVCGGGAGSSWCTAHHQQYTHSGTIIGILCPVSHYRLPSQANCLQRAAAPSARGLPPPPAVSAALAATADPTCGRPRQGTQMGSLGVGLAAGARHARLDPTLNVQHPPIPS